MRTQVRRAAKLRYHESWYFKVQAWWLERRDAASYVFDGTDAGQFQQLPAWAAALPNRA
jgi:hypothetical protein